MPRKATVDKKAETVSLDDVQAANTLKSKREDKRNKSLTKDMMYGNKAYKRTVRDTIEERDRRMARLHSFGGERDVIMVWDWNPEAIRDQVFMIRVGNKEAFISAVELQKYLRWV